MSCVRNFASAAFALAACALSPVGAVKAESFTTRIETRPFYGATVTLEEGVRVIRALPPERQVIINPDGRTPLYLGFNQTNVYSYSYVSGVSEDREPVAVGPRVLYGGGVGRSSRGWHDQVGSGHAGGSPGMKHIPGMAGAHGPAPHPMMRD